MADYRRRLPHLHPNGAYLFVTWRLYGSLPVALREVIYATPGQEFAAKDRALAEGRGPQWLADTQVARKVVETLLLGEEEKLFYELPAWAIMPNHVHLLMLPQVAPPKIMQWIKGRSAREANSLLGRTGQPFWQDESYDHWVRNRREFDKIVAYIEENPVSAGLVSTSGDWPFSSASRAG